MTYNCVTEISTSKGVVFSIGLDRSDDNTLVTSDEESDSDSSKNIVDDNE